jgi:hypothetical protein
MGISIVLAYDAIHSNVHLLPKGLAMGYSTGSGIVPWTEADWAAHPGAVRICQDVGATDATADVLDVERGAATFADCPGWAKRAMASFEAVRRPGQRTPAIYTSASNVTSVVNALVKGGVAAGVGLIIANWNLSEATAAAEVMAASGPFPIQGFQYRNMGAFDADVLNDEWVLHVSRKPTTSKSTKPTRHISLGTESLAQEAGSETRLQEAIWLTAHNSPDGFGPAQRSYFGNADMSKHMPIGMIYWLPA